MLALGSLMVCGSLVRAEETKPADAPNAPANAPAAKHKAKGNKGGGGPLQEALAKLNLTDDQKEQVRNAMKEQREKMQAINQDSALSKEDKQAKRKAAFDGLQDKMKTILTPDQYAKFQEETKHMREHGAGGPGAHKPRPEGAGAPPPVPGGDK